MDTKINYSFFDKNNFQFSTKSFFKSQLPESVSNDFYKLFESLKNPIHTNKFYENNIRKVTDSIYSKMLEMKKNKELMNKEVVSNEPTKSNLNKNTGNKFYGDQKKTACGINLSDFENLENLKRIMLTFMSYDKNGYNIFIPKLMQLNYNVSIFNIEKYIKTISKPMDNPKIIIIYDKDNNDNVVELSFNKISIQDLKKLSSNLMKNNQENQILYNLNHQTESKNPINLYNSTMDMFYNYDTLEKYIKLIF